ncbi:MAG TPA: CopG family transcriptional regulator [Mycobacteriales bacterium]|jgi:plasmid stability protein|nr:CopG family transcriptional regulator [Mycobacteriales bacterium]
MVKTTLYMSDELKSRLKRRAVQTRRSEAEIMREALDRALAEDEPRPRPRLGGFRSGDPTITARIDDILADEFGAEAIDR